MKTILISGIYKPDIGGPATFIPKLASKLIHKNHKVKVITLRDSSSVEIIEAWPIEYVIRNQNLVSRFIKTSFVILKNGLSFDCIFANGLFQESAIANLFLRVHSVAKVSGDPVWERATNKGRTNLSRIEFNKSKLGMFIGMQRLFLRWSLNRFDIITCPSKELQSLILNWGVKREIKVIPNGISPIDLMPVSKVFDVITISRLVKLKNLDKLIVACARTKSRLAIVGSGPEFEYLTNLKNKLNADVTFLGQLNEDEILDYLNKSKIFALVSDSEGLSFALLQAMACGIPSIVSNIQGNTDVVDNHQEGLIIDLDIEYSIDRAIEFLLHSPQKLALYGEQAKIKARAKYDLNEKLSETINLFSGK